eukprot:GAHX01000703.1.p1 GENE.GAHX01000703.1~~GAHX01000703.1.p1  ORF type:complete len:197 (-),score=40.25 GAHX01000703.1:30-620(-)
MKILSTQHEVIIPSDVQLTLEKSLVTVTGPLGSMSRDFGHAGVFMRLIDGDEAKKLQISLYLAKRKRAAIVKTIKKHIENMINGIQRGYSIKLVAMFDFFNIEVTVEDQGKTLFIKKFYNKSFVARFDMPEGVTVELSDTCEFQNGKEFILSGVEIEKITQLAAVIRSKVRAKNKDKRYFVDGVYPVSKGYNEIAA